jgi:hypothetical protein
MAEQACLRGGGAGCILPSDLQEAIESHDCGGYAHMVDLYFYAQVRVVSLAIRFCFDFCSIIQRDQLCSNYLDNGADAVALEDLPWPGWPRGVGSGPGLFPEIRGGPHNARLTHRYVACWRRLAFFASIFR